MSYLRTFNNEGLTEDGSLPFDLVFNFSRLFDWWQNRANSDDASEAAHAIKVLEEVNKFAALKQSHKNFDELAQYQPQLQLLFEPFFPEISTNFDYKTAGIAFKPWFFNLTKRLDSLMEACDNDIRVPMRDKDMLYIFACISVLNAHYQVNVPFFHDLHFDFHDKRTGAVKRFLSKIDARFVELLPTSKAKDLTPEDFKELFERFDDVRLWKEKIPPGSFRMEGFTIMSLFDVTRSEAIAALKYDLLDRDAFVDPKILSRIENNLCQVLTIESVRTSVMLYDHKRELLKPLGMGLGEKVVPSHKVSPLTFFGKHASALIIGEGKPLIMADVNNPGGKYITISKSLIENGIHSYLAIPLYYGGELIGVLELGAGKAGTLTGMSAYLLRDILPLLANAIRRLHDEIMNEIQALIRANCTAIHPAVSWRFNEAAEQLLERQRCGEKDAVDMEEILFENVFPLYGQADIKDSSASRNRAIQLDLIRQLTFAKDVLEAAGQKSPLPVYKDLLFRTNNFIDELQLELSAGADNRVQEFFHDQIDPVFSFLRSGGGELKPLIESYCTSLDPVLNMNHDHRRLYDESVKRINTTVSEYLEKAQAAAQQMYPHYFEKYKTDGVEHNLYIGQSMVENREFHPLYLQNLRLWQLLVCCEIENEVAKIPANERSSLQICSLILVHSNPVSIRFRMDEKKFDVDGAYNIRYEILKKRIDKAQVKGSLQRLTQPGKLSIVYSQEREAKEYQNYLMYLQSIGYIGNQIEKLDLHDMQGLTGLKALRVEVVYDPAFAGIHKSKSSELVR
ncbi:MAG: GAF domain-containing protein [Flavitalea sp.]